MIKYPAILSNVESYCILTNIVSGELWPWPWILPKEWRGELWPCILPYLVKGRGSRGGVQGRGESVAYRREVPWSLYGTVDTMLHSFLCTVQCTLYYSTVHSTVYTGLSSLNCTLHTGDCMTVEGGALLIGVLGNLRGIFTSCSLLSFHTTLQ